MIFFQSLLFLFLDVRSCCCLILLSVVDPMVVDARVVLVDSAGG
jgi:hypothetical protein